MAGGYKVELGELETLVSTLENAEKSMTSANDALRDSSAKDLGSASLDKAGNDFQDKWEYGIGKLAELSEKMAKGLKQTEKTYEHAEQEIKKLFPDMPSGSSGSNSPDSTPAPDNSGTPGNPHSHIGRVLGGDPSAQAGDTPPTAGDDPARQA